jgi:hypothetical protein
MLDASPVMLDASSRMLEAYIGDAYRVPSNVFNILY